MNKIEEDNNLLGNTTNSDSPNENGKRMKSRIRSTKKELYQKEREEFIKELNNIIGINNDNNNVFKHDIEKNADFSNFIKENTEKIRKMWKTGLWGYFSNDIEKGSGNILGLYRTLLNDSDYMIFSKQKIINIGGNKERRTCYYVEKKHK